MIIALLYYSGMVLTVSVVQMGRHSVTAVVTCICTGLPRHVVIVVYPLDIQGLLYSSWHINDLAILSICGQNLQKLVKQVVIVTLSR